ncbi:hypothetical protein [Comamonas odontotermitis]|uniref:hypothetical protein n=1 Tax=Comamonas odontotermitis TaxID=379895 RepID=UPI003751958E
MKNTKRIRTLRSAIAASVVALSCTASWAARDFTPQAGTWVISEELDGKPGRGLAIDVQGNTFFMQVFGYEKNGDATFYTAIGEMDGNMVTAPLFRYEGGRHFGGHATDAVESNFLGNAIISFTNGLAGIIELPNEKPKKIERLLIDNRKLEDETLRKFDHVKSSLWWVLDEEKNSTLQLFAELHMPTEDTYLLRLSSASFNDYLFYNCQRMEGVQKFNCESVVSNGNWVPFPQVKFQILGSEVVARLRDRNGSHLEAIGAAMGVGKSLKGAVSLCNLYQYTYMPGIGCSNWQVPANGTWIFADEQTGKPGRGISVDVQDKTTILQVFNYLPNGQPSFHMGSSILDMSSDTDARTGARNIPLSRYAGGRHLGGPASTAAVVQGDPEAGNAVISFRAQPPGSSQDFVSGSLQLPGEGAKPLVRLDLEGLSPPARLLGQWIMRFDNLREGGQQISRKVNLTTMIDNAAISNDGSTVCTPSGSDNTYRCDAYTDAHRTIKWGTFDASFNGFTVHDARAIQLRDRFGNWRGLGNVVLD